MCWGTTFTKANSEMDKIIQLPIKHFTLYYQLDSVNNASYTLLRFWNWRMRTLGREEWRWKLRETKDSNAIEQEAESFLGNTNGTLLNCLTVRKWWFCRIKPSALSTKCSWKGSINNHYCKSRLDQLLNVSWTQKQESILEHLLQKPPDMNLFAP